MVEKVGDIKAKANLQPTFYVKEIDSRCPKGHRPLAKNNKKDNYRESRNEVSNKDKDNAKSHNSFSANQPQTQTPKKDKRGRQGDHLAAGVNATGVAKKDKNKAPKDLNYVKCYSCKQKGQYANKYLEMFKN